MKVPRGTLLALLCSMTAGCETAGTAPASVKAAVPEAPCKASLAPKPVYPADTLTGEEDIWVLGTQLWADRKARQARELVLETTIEGCTKPPAQ